MVGVAAVLAVFLSYVLIPHTTMTVNGIVQAKTLADQYIARIDSDLKVAEVEEWTLNYYVRVQEKSTGINAFELLIDKSTGRTGPEPGPNMMWNTRYGMMGGMMGGFQGTSVVNNMNINPEKTVEIAQTWLDSNFPSAQANDPDTFYGYYTLDFSKSGNIAGMLSVNGYTGEVWFHSWHGTFIVGEETN